MSYAQVARKASKTWRCPCGRTINPGDIYIHHTEFPGGDAGYADYAGHPVSMPECAEEAERYGRGHLIQERRNR